MTERISKYLKAIAACAACAGILITPEHQTAIIAGFTAIYGIISGAEGKLFKK